MFSCSGLFHGFRCHIFSMRTSAARASRPREIRKDEQHRDKDDQDYDHLVSDVFFLGLCGIDWVVWG